MLVAAIVDRPNPAKPGMTGLQKQLGELMICERGLRGRFQPTPQLGEFTFRSDPLAALVPNPKMSAPRSHTSPVLLSGLGKCGCEGCSSTMMLMTGKGGLYRYYTCSNRRVKGDLSCGGNNLPMEAADNAVITALEKRLFQPDRLEALLGQMLDSSREADGERRKRLTVLRTEETEVRKAIRALYIMAERDSSELEDPFLKERMATNKARLASTGEEVVRLERQTGSKSDRITPAKVAQFTEVMRQRLRDPADPQMRRAYVRAFVGEVVMTRQQITIRGPNRAIELAVAGEMSSDDQVRSFSSDWCTRSDSNARPSDS